MLFCYECFVFLVKCWCFIKVTVTAMCDVVDFLPFIELIHCFQSMFCQSSFPLLPLTPPLRNKLASNWTRKRRRTPPRKKAKNNGRKSRKTSPVRSRSETSISPISWSVWGVLGWGLGVGGCDSGGAECEGYAVEVFRGCLLVRCRSSHIRFLTD